MLIHKLPNLPLLVDGACSTGSWKYDDIPAHCHGFLEGIYVEDGCINVTVDNTVYSLMPKNLILLDSSLMHSMQFSGDTPGTILRFSFSFDESNTSVFPGLLNMLNISLDICRMLISLNQALVFPDAHGLRNSLLKLIREFDSRKDKVYLTTLAYHLLCELSRLPLTEKTSVQAYVEKADQYIHEFFYQIKNNEQIAAHVGLNATYLERIYKKSTGVSLWESVTSCRLLAAKELLAKPGIPIREVEERIGFANRQTFYLQFKKRFGISPSEYRKNSIQTQ